MTLNGSCCCSPTPIIVDISGKGIQLTSAIDGVDFDIAGRGRKVRVAWTAAGSQNAWLVLDRNENGVIDDGTELFGDATPQPAPPAGEGRNGFLALAVYDRPEKAGNSDGVIDVNDAIFSKLRLWQDLNHNGPTELGELRTLSSLGVSAMELDYHEAHPIDRYGNMLRFRAKTRDERGAHIGSWAWDVILKLAPTQREVSTVH